MIAINSIDKAVIGLFGFTVKIDISLLLMSKINAVQVGRYETLADPQLEGNFPAPVTQEVELNVLNSYLNNYAAPRLAFNHGDAELTVFCKNTDGIPDYANSYRYRVGDYIRKAVDETGKDAIFECITGGISDSSEAIILYEFTETGTITENAGVQWIFVEYEPIQDAIVYDAKTMLILFGLRNSQPCAIDADKIDAPDKDINLVVNYALGTLWNVKKQHIPIKIQNIIDKEELRIKNE